MNFKIKQNNPNDNFLVMGLTALLTTSTVTPLMMRLATHFRFKQKDCLAFCGNLFQSNYKKKFQQWLVNYIEQSQSELEIKYKIIFTSLWMHSKKIKTNDVFDMQSNFIKNLSEKFQYEQKTSSDLFSLFINDENLNLSLTENISFIKAKLVAKKVCSDFYSIGLAGKNFMGWSASEMMFIMPLQEYKLTYQDIKEIKTITQNNFKTPTPFNHSLLFTDLSAHYCTKIISENIEHIQVLKKFFSSLGQDNKIKNISSLLDKFEKASKISSNLSALLPEKKQIIKINKI